MSIEMKGRLRLAGVAAALVAGLAIVQAQNPITVTMKDVQGKSMGTVMISKEVSGGLKFALDLKGMPPGQHAIGVYSLPQCAGQNFSAVGSVFNPGHKNHGPANDPESQAGTLGNFTVGADGTSKATVVSKMLTMGEDTFSIYAAGGTALVIHSGMDDGKSQPSGNSGTKIACGEIKKAK